MTRQGPAQRPNLHPRLQSVAVGGSYERHIPRGLNCQAVSSSAGGRAEGDRYCRQVPVNVDGPDCRVRGGRQAIRTVQTRPGDAFHQNCSLCKPLVLCLLPRGTENLQVPGTAAPVQGFVCTEAAPGSGALLQPPANTPHPALELLQAVCTSQGLAVAP